MTPLHDRPLAAPGRSLVPAPLPPPVPEIDRLRREAPPLLACLRAIQEQIPTLQELRRRTVVLEALARQSKGSSTPRLRPLVAEEILQVHKHLQELQRGLQGKPYPFTPSNEGTDLSRWAVPSCRARKRPIRKLSRRRLRLHPDARPSPRVLGRLARSAEAMEEALEAPAGKNGPAGSS